MSGFTGSFENEAYLICFIIALLIAVASYLFNNKIIPVSISFICFIPLLAHLAAVEFFLDYAHGIITSIVKHNDNAIHYFGIKFNILAAIKDFIPKETVDAYNFFRTYKEIVMLIIPSLWAWYIVYFIRFIKQNRKADTFCILHVFSLLILCLSFYISHLAGILVFDAIRNDIKYLNTADKNKGIIKTQSKALSNIIIEPSIVTRDDLKRLKEIIERYEEINLFIGQTILMTMQNESVRNEFIQYIKDNKNKISVYADIEFTYGNTGMLSQMALSASLSHSLIYKECHGFAKDLKNNYGVDYIFGPVLDRRTSNAESTIGARSFGQHIELLEENSFICTLAFQNAGVQAIPKHFPGHPQIFGRDINPHVGNFSTQYANESLANNALPFIRLSRNPFIKSQIFMTDHIAIASLDKDLPYSIYFDIENKKFGINEAKKIFLTDALNRDSEFYFITDDLNMLIRGQQDTDKARESITSKTKISTSINASVAKHIAEQAKNFQGIDYTNAIEALAILARSALLAGHNMILIRGMSTDGIDFFSSKFSTIIASERKILQDSLKPRIMPTVNVPNDNLDTTRYPFSIIHVPNNSMLNFTFNRLLNNKDEIFYMSSCISRDDIASAFGLVNDDLTIRSDLFSDHLVILKDATLGEEPKNREKKIEKILSNKNFEYYIIALSNRGSIRYFDVVFQFLHKNKKLDRMLVFLCNTPDILSSNQLYGLVFDKKYGNIYSLSNYFCFYENSYRIKQYIKDAINNNKRLGDVFHGIQSIPIDIPNYYLGRYNRNIIEKQDDIDSLINIENHSAILKDEMQIKTYISLALLCIISSSAFYIFSLFIEGIYRITVAQLKCNKE